MPKNQQTPADALNSLMDEYQINPFSLSKQIGLSTSSVRNIATGKSGVTAPTALRFAKFFGQSPSFWLDLQLQTDMQKAENDKELQSALKAIPKVKKPVVAKAKPKDKSAKANTLAEKRKKAAKVPGAKQAKGKQANKEKKK